MKITSIETHVLLDPSYDPAACSSAQDDLVVLIHTDDGITGIGEVDTNPWATQAMIHAPGTHALSLGLAEMLLGQAASSAGGSPSGQALHRQFHERTARLGSLRDWGARHGPLGHPGKSLWQALLGIPSAEPAKPRSLHTLLCFLPALLSMRIVSRC